MQFRVERAGLQSQCIDAVWDLEWDLWDLEGVSWDLYAH